MSGHLELISGVAGSGKTDYLLAEYRTALIAAMESRRLGSTLWIAPTNRVKKTLTLSLLNADLPVCFAPNVFTFDKFAEQILRASGQDIVLIREAAQRRLVRRVIDKLDDEGRIPYFSRIARTSGFLDLAISFITELKRAEIWPEHFITACLARGEHAKDRELTLVYQTYQDQLQALRLYDAEGRFWMARTALEQGIHGPFENLSLVVVDGFTDFTRTQHEILSHLAAASERVLVGLAFETPLVRGDLFAKTDQVRSNLQREKSATISFRELERRDTERSQPAPITEIADRLFEVGRESSAATDTIGIEILSATGELGEVQAIAVRVKQLLHQGVAADDIVVTFRSVSECADLIDEVFEAAGIPYFSEVGTPLSRLPVVKALVNVLQLEADDWAFPSLMRVLDSNFFRPKWNEWQPEKSARDVAAMLRIRRLFSQRSVILDEIERPFRGDDEQPEARVRIQQREAIRKSAASFLRRLAKETERLHSQHDFRTWVDIVIALGRELGISADDQNTKSSPAYADAGNRSVEQEKHDWDLLERILHDAATVDQLIPFPAQEIGLNGFLRQLVDLLHSQRTSGGSNEVGRVRVLDAAQVRNLDVPYLFLAGLTENQFPRIRHDNCLYNDSERRQLNDSGLTLRDIVSQNQDEMLLFYGVVTRARRRLVLSYPSESTGGQLLFPSPYLTAVQELFAEGSIETNHVSSLDPVPNPRRIVSKSDFRVAAVDQSLHGEPELFVRLFDQTELAEPGRNILAGVDAVSNRFEENGFTSFEGLIRNGRNIAWLKEKFPDGHEYSATQLENFAQCPFRWLLSDVLKFRSLESTETSADARVRGIVVHNVLARLHNEELSGQTVFDPKDPTTVASRFREIAEEELNRQPAATRIEQALIELERRVLGEMATRYANQWANYVTAYSQVWDERPRPSVLEFAFGQTRDEEATGNSAIEFGGQVRVGGRVDRADVGSVDGSPVFNVIDYKTGAIHRFDVGEIESGKTLQLAVYGLAIQRLGIIASDARPFQLAYWELKDRGFKTGKKNDRKRKPTAMDSEFLDAVNQTLEETIPNLTSNLRDGAFPVFNDDEGCTRYCDFHTVCRVRELRKVAQHRNKVFHVSKRVNDTAVPHDDENERNV